MKTIGSIVFDKAAIYGIVASGSPENPTIHKVIYLNRSENLEADWDSIKENFYDTSSIGIVESTPPMTFTKKYINIDDYIDSEKEIIESKNMNEYAFNYITFYDELELPRLYYVGIKKYILQRLMNIFISSKMHKQLDLIDYWPFGINGFDSKHKSYRTTIIESDTGITGYVWFKDILLTQEKLEEGESTIAFVIRLWSSLPNSSISNHPINLYIEKEHIDFWSTLISNYEVNVFSTPIDANQGKNGCWNVAFGMAKRILYKFT